MQDLHERAEPPRPSALGKPPIIPFRPSPSSSWARASSAPYQPGSVDALHYHSGYSDMCPTWDSGRKEAALVLPAEASSFKTRGGTAGTAADQFPNTENKVQDSRIDGSFGEYHGHQLLPRGQGCQSARNMPWLHGESTVCRERGSEVIRDGLGVRHPSKRNREVIVGTSQPADAVTQSPPWRLASALPISIARDQENTPIVRIDKEEASTARGASEPILPRDQEGGESPFEFTFLPLVRQQPEASRTPVSQIRSTSSSSKHVAAPIPGPESIRAHVPTCNHDKEADKKDDEGSRGDQDVSAARSGSWFSPSDATGAVSTTTGENTPSSGLGWDSHPGSGGQGDSPIGSAGDQSTELEVCSLVGVLTCGQLIFIRTATTTSTKSTNLSGN